MARFTVHCSRPSTRTCLRCRNKMVRSACGQSGRAQKLAPIRVGGSKKGWPTCVLCHMRTDTARSPLAPRSGRWGTHCVERELQEVTCRGVSCGEAACGEPRTGYTRGSYAPGCQLREDHAPSCCTAALRTPQHPIGLVDRALRRGFLRQLADVSMPYAYTSGAAPAGPRRLIGLQLLELLCRSECIGNGRAALKLADLMRQHAALGCAKAGAHARVRTRRYQVCDVKRAILQRAPASCRICRCRSQRQALEATALFPAAMQPAMRIDCRARTPVADVVLARG